MKTYDISNRLSKQAKAELERIISTHETYKNSYFRTPSSSASGRRSNERRFLTNNPPVNFIYNGSLIHVSMNYSESCKNVYYSLLITKDDFYKDPSCSNPIPKNISLIKKLLK